jgi:hypothetical protein
MRRFSTLCMLAAAIVLAAAGESDAQGKGRPKAPKSAPASPIDSTPVPAPAGSNSVSAPSNSAAVEPTVGVLPAGSAATSFRQFGSWLDDASAPVRGEGYVSISAGHWRMSGMTQTNIPMVAAGIGLTDRVQIGASVPFYQAHFDAGTARGMDDVYLNAKYTIVDPALSLSEVGLAVSPVVEFLSAGTPGRRVHFAVPVSVELRRLPFRVYASAGYFTRGSVFSGGALEWSSSGGLTLGGSLTQSYSLQEDAALDALAVGRQRMDVSASAAYAMTPNIGASVSVGRSLSSQEDGGTSLALSGGVSFRLAP